MQPGNPAADRKAFNSLCRSALRRNPVAIRSCIRRSSQAHSNWVLAVCRPNAELGWFFDGNGHGSSDGPSLVRTNGDRGSRTPSVRRPPMNSGRQLAAVPEPSSSAYSVSAPAAGDRAFVAAAGGRAECRRVSPDLRLPDSARPGYCFKPTADETAGKVRRPVTEK